MAKARAHARCDACGHEQTRWTGQCGGCGQWATLVEVAGRAVSSPAVARSAAAATPIADVPLELSTRRATGSAEFDRVLGGGLVPGQVAVLGGAPGIGKSTLCLQTAQRVAAAGARVLYVCGEESPSQVRLRAQRLGALDPGLLVTSATDVASVTSLIASERPDLVVVDSIQTLTDPALPSAPGSIAQVTAAASRLVRVAKEETVTIIFVGHLTKDGSLAGPRALEHLVDTVLTFEGEEHHALRLLRATKHRFGAVGEIGCFEMTEQGMSDVVDPARTFLAPHDGMPAGVATTIALEGPRPLAVEIQALVGAAATQNPRRHASGFDGSRLVLLAAALQRHAGVPLHDRDVFVSTVAGVRVREPGADLATCLAIASSRADAPLVPGVIAIGEVGLAGEVRPVSQVNVRLREAARLGFVVALVSSSRVPRDAPLRLLPVRDLAAAVGAAGGRRMISVA